MHANRVSRQRNIIRLHSYVEYFSRDTAGFVSPLAFPLDGENFHEHPSTDTRECVDRLKCATSVDVRLLSKGVQKEKDRAEGDSNFCRLNRTFENRTPIARVDVFEGCNFEPSTIVGNLPGGQCEKSANFRPETSPLRFPLFCRRLFIQICLFCTSVDVPMDEMELRPVFNYRFYLKR